MKRRLDQLVISTRHQDLLSKWCERANLLYSCSPDGLVATRDRITEYVGSVRQGTVSRIRPGQPPDIVAAGIPSAASMAYDAKRQRRARLARP